MGKLLDIEASRLISRYKIQLPPQFFSYSPKKALHYSKLLGFPVVLKVVSQDIVHKTESKGIILDVMEQDVEKACKNIIEHTKRFNPEAKIDGILVQKQLKGHEFIVGGKQDSQFGPVVIYGAGGIFAELLNDVSIRLAPIDRKEAEEMVSEVRMSRLLTGFRGKARISLRPIIRVLLKVSKMMEKENIKEMDINPLIVNSSGAFAVDVRIVK